VEKMSWKARGNIRAMSYSRESSGNHHSARLPFQANGLYSKLTLILSLPHFRLFSVTPVCLLIIKETQRFDRHKSHICPDHLRCATPTKVVMWRGVPCQVSSKSVQGFWLLEGSKSAIFLCLALWLI